MGKGRIPMGGIPQRSDRRSAIGAMAAGLVMAAFMPRSASAVMAGVPPDSPDARIDPNTAGSPWAGVGAVLVDGRIYSGALIGRRHVLTAAHVVGAASAGQVGFQINAGDESRRIAAEAVFRHPDYQDSGDAFPQFDAAIIRLARDVPAAIPVYPFFEGAVVTGTPITMVGYGASGRGDEGPSIEIRADTRRMGRNVIDKLVPVPGSDTRAGVFIFDFDGPDPASNTTGGEGLGNSVEASVAVGDSGSPAFVVSGEHRAIVGIMGFVDDLDPEQSRLSRFGGIGGGTLVEPLREWIAEILRDC